jgi:hypothetical protein
VELSLPSLREALALWLPLTVVTNWDHRRAVHALRTVFPEAKFFYAISWSRFTSARQEVRRRVGDGSYRKATVVEGA